MTPGDPVPASGKVPLRPGAVAARLTLLAGLLAFGGLGLVGIPGALWLAAAAPLAGLLTDREAAGDAMWPMAILHTIAWPWLLPVAYLIAAALFPRGRKRVLATLGGTALGAILVALAFQLAAGRIS